jgi:hypothetical protein
MKYSQIRLKKGDGPRSSVYIATVPVIFFSDQPFLPFLALMNSVVIKRAKVKNGVIGLAPLQK